MEEFDFNKLKRPANYTEYKGEEKSSLCTNHDKFTELEEQNMIQYSNIADKQNPNINRDIVEQQVLDNKCDLTSLEKKLNDRTDDLEQKIKDNWLSLEKYFLTLRASLISNSNKKTMDNNDLLLFAKVLVWYASKEKVEFLKRRLRKNNIMDVANQIVIKQQIKSELIRLSMEWYIDYLRDYSIWTVGNLWDWIYSNFPMGINSSTYSDAAFNINGALWWYSLPISYRCS